RNLSLHSDRRSVANPLAELESPRANPQGGLNSERCSKEVVAALIEVGDDEGGAGLLKHDGGIPSCSYSYSFVTRGASGGDVERCIADDEYFFSRDRISVPPSGCFPGFADELRSIFGIRTESAKTEIPIETAALQFGSRSEFDVARRETEHGIRT